jgi:hypothetical protein
VVCRNDNQLLSQTTDDLKIIIIIIISYVIYVRGTNKQPITNNQGCKLINCNFNPLFQFKARD